MPTSYPTANQDEAKPSCLPHAETMLLGLNDAHHGHSERFFRIVPLTGTISVAALTWIFSIFLTLITEAQTWRSTLYPENWTPPVGSSFAKDKLIQDFSYAGYRRGESKIPTPNTHVRNAVTEYGADPSGATDSTKAIQTALDAAGKAGGGVVLLPPGTYKISLPHAGSASVLRISKSNTILRGSGAGRTFLLNESTVMRSKSIISIRGDEAPEPVASQRLTADVLSPVKRLFVANAASLSVGDIIGVRWDFTQEWIDEHGQSAVWKAGGVAPAPAIYQREVMAVNPSEGWIETDIPARYYHLIRDNARIEKQANRIHECGVEGISIGNVQNPGKGWQSEDHLVSGTGAYDVHASWVINFNRARNCWAREVHSYQPKQNSFTCHILSNGVLLELSSNITLRNCSMKRPEYGGSDGNGYMFRMTHSNDCLIEHCLADFSRHGFVNSHAGSSGNVFHKCEDRNTKSSTGDTGYIQTGGDGSDNHMHFSHSSLWDQCHAYESWWEAVHRGWNYQALAAAHCVYWNTSGSGSATLNRGKIVRSGQARYGYVIGTHGIQHGIELRITGKSKPIDIAEGEGLGKALSPSSLYQDQMARRLGKQKTKVTILSKGAGESGPGLDFSVKFDHLGLASSGTAGMEITGETHQADFYDATLGVRLEAIKKISTQPATLGDLLVAGKMDRDSAGYLGIIGSPGDQGLAAEPGNTEGISFGLTHLPGFNQESQVSLDTVTIRWMDVGESVTVVNRLTRRSITLQGSALTYPEVTMDVSALAISAKAGQMKNVGVIFPGIGSNIRITGVELELAGALPKGLPPMGGPIAPLPSRKTSFRSPRTDHGRSEESASAFISKNRVIQGE